MGAGANEQNDSGKKAAAVRWGLQSVIFLLIFGACLFVSSGNFSWLWAWLYLAVYLVGQIVIGANLVASNPQLITERTSVERSTARSWDRPLSGMVSLFGPISILIVSGLDERFGWTGAVSPALQYAGLVLIILGTALVAWAMIVNRYFYGFVRVQEEQGHSVTSSGPYRLVRHPGYLAGVLADVGAPLLLGSGWAFIPAAITIAALVVRTSLEDRTLQEELSGYKAYTQKTRSRLIPGIW